MSDPPNLLEHDLQASPPEVRIALSRAGVTGVNKAIRIRHAESEKLIAARIDCTVDLDPEQKGVHMSRFPSLFEEAIDEVVIGEAFLVEDLAEHIARHIVERQRAGRAEVTITASYPLERRTPVTSSRRRRWSRSSGSPRRPRTGSAGSSASRRPGSTPALRAGARARPSAERLREAGFDELDVERILELVPLATHNQRGRGTLYVGTRARVNAEQLVRIVESSMSSPVYELLKRPDELFVVEHAHLQPRFVEDSVRLALKGALDAYPELDDGDFLLARQLNFETIHNHDVVAERYGTAGELRAESKTGTRRAVTRSSAPGSPPKSLRSRRSWLWPWRSPVSAADRPPATGWLGGAAPTTDTAPRDGRGRSARAWSLQLDGRVTAQPVVVRGVPARGQLTVYVGTSGGSVYAISGTGRLRWRVRFGRLQHRCGFLDGYGVTGTPAVDADARILYVADAFGMLHALDLDDGDERSGWPVRVLADQQREHVFGGLLVARDSVYVPAASYCDVPMEGKLVRVQTANRRVSRWISVPSAWAAAAASGASAAPRSAAAEARSSCHRQRYEGARTLARASANTRPTPSASSSSPRRCSCAPRTTRPRSPRRRTSTSRAARCSRSRAAARSSSRRSARPAGSTPGGRTASATVAWRIAAARRRASSASRPGRRATARSTSRRATSSRGSRSPSHVARAWSGRARASTRRVADGRRRLVWFGRYFGRSYLTAVDAKTGRPRRNLCVKGTPLAAPAVLDGSLYAATFDGWVYGFLRR